MQSVLKSLLFVAVLCLSATFSAYAAEDKVEHDRSNISVFVQPSVSFINFEQRKYFQSAIDTIYQSFREAAVTENDSLNVAKQDFQKVNFCFPISAGIQFQVLQDHFISAGVGFIYDNESVVLKDKKDKAHNYSYTIQGVPMFLEYRFAIPKNFMSLSGESLFSVAARWYWVLPGTEIYTTWGKMEAKTPLTGVGFGVSLGYLIASWKNFNVYGDIGFSSISVESDRKFSHIVPDGPEEKAKWNIGGLQMQFRVSFGLWNKPVEMDSVEQTHPKPGDKRTPALNSKDSVEKEIADQNTPVAENVEMKPAETEIAGNDNSDNTGTKESEENSEAVVNKSSTEE